MRILRGLRLKVLVIAGLTVVAFLAGLVGNGTPAVGQTSSGVCNVCSTNAVFDPACDDCKERVAAGPQMSSCRYNWNAGCMADARELCGGVVCSCPHSICQQGEFLYPSCDETSPHGQCVEQMGQADPYCSGIFWDQVCVDKVATICGIGC